MRWPRTGRLFWKLLLALWLSMNLSILATMVFFHLHPHRPHHPPDAPPGLPPNAPVGMQAMAPRPPPPPPPPRSGLDLIPVPPLVSGAAASLLTSLLLAWYLSRPLHHLRWALHQVAEGRFDTRVRPRMGTRRDEIVDLAQDFDRMAQELQKLTEARQTLLHDVSHELRSPLARMQAAIGLSRQDPTQAGELLERIEREGQRLDALIEELLTLHRLESSAPVGELARVDVVELLQAVVDDADFEARAVGKSVVLDAPTPFVSRVHGELMCRAFENVIRNAVKFSPEGGQVEVQARVETRVEAQGPLPTGRTTCLVCHVRDRGPGVPEEMLGAIFMPFVRAEGAVAAGSGLGLAIARRALSLHGGEVSARRRTGGGLTVTLRLPVDGAASVPPSAHIYPA